MLTELAQRTARLAVAQARRQVVMVMTMSRAGVVRPHNPVRLAQVGKALKDWGMGFAGGITAMRLLNGDQAALIDELGTLTWAEVDARTNALADALSRSGVAEGDSVAVLCRNHRYFLEVSTALAKLGADILYLNTSFAAPQLGEVCAREQPTAVIYDEEFEGLIDRSGVEMHRILAWSDGEVDRDKVEALIASGSGAPRRPSGRLSRPVILTSGTTGTPKGAPRSEAGLDGAVALLSRMPFRSGDTVHIAAPVFHTWGWAHLNLAMLLGSTIVLRRRFDPADCLATLDEHDCEGLVVIPVMLQRMLRLPEEQRAGDYTQLRVVAASGSALPGDLATEWMDTFGDNLYNTYGSTEVAWATIAQPQDMRAAPGTAGKPPPNTVVRIYDEHDQEAPVGSPGRIFVGNSMLFGGYTGGGHKQFIDGLMSTGDIGRMDEEGRLFVEGRDDEMIVSGGENVFPKEVEDCLTRHEAVVEAAAVGVDDPDFGKRLRAFVVLADGTEPDEDTLKTWIKDNLARYKVPREFVFLPELPRNATGKVLKRELVDWSPED
ncbi:AMP-binding protein [Nocardioides terrisoli]|uniref:AMP-binding protein n=1 Tax=Nocardioides terrisoli TaxID=3388267 RepID=UPI00287B6CC4|nr:AMP-binding protein [Nocardioides marmorisolisilvae]